MLPLIEALRTAAHEVRACSVCGNLGGRDPCEYAATAGATAA